MPQSPTPDPKKKKPSRLREMFAPAARAWDAVRGNPFSDFALGLTPAGVAADIQDFASAARSGDMLGMGLATVGGIPIAGDALKGGGKALRAALGSADDLPMDEASRMARAREMGFDVDRTLYRGTTNRGEISPKESFEAGGGIFTTDNPDVAEIFRYPREFGEVITEKYDPDLDEYLPVDPGDLQNLYVNRGKSFLVDNPQRFTDDTAYQSSVIKRAKSEGYDTIEVPNVREGVGDWNEMGNTVVVLNPQNVRSTNARFDPAQRESRNLFASLAVPALLTGGMLNRDRQRREEY